jgi:hypothetical protein
MNEGKWNKHLIAVTYSQQQTYMHTVELQTTQQQYN